MCFELDFRILFLTEVSDVSQGVVVNLSEEADELIFSTACTPPSSSLENSSDAPKPDFLLSYNKHIKIK